MIVTVTPNPSVDRTLHIPALVHGAVHRTSTETTEPSGKGVNVALAIHRSGGTAHAVLPVGGHSGAHLASMIEAAGLAHSFVPVTAETRSNVSLIEPDGTTTKINELGPELTAGQLAELTTAALAASGPGDWVAWCGSLPPGVTPGDLAGQLARCRSAGRKVALDSSGAALATAATGPREARPDLIKPNADELAELTGRPLHTIGDVARAAGDLVRSGIGTVLVSLGADGAVLAEDGLVLHGAATAARVVNTAGAGDAFLAGYLCAPGGPEDRLASALRFGAAAVAQRGTLLVPPASPPPVAVTPADPAQRLGPSATEGTPDAASHRLPEPH